MAVTRSKRAANNKWDKENMKIVACKIRKEQAEQFKQYAEDRGTTSNALLKNYVLECIGEIDKQKGTKQALQEAAKDKGESINGYIKNAVQARYEADTGEKIEL